MHLVLEVAQAEGFDGDAAMLGELDRIGDQIEQDLAQPPGIAAQAVGHIGLDEGGEIDALAMGARAMQLADALQQVGEVEVDGLQRQLAGLELGVV